MKRNFLKGSLLIAAVSASLFCYAGEPKEITSVELGPINTKMVNDGKGLFNAKCMMCHDLDQKRVGPALRSVTKSRKPEYVMNVILNPTKMQKSDATMKDLLKKFNNVPMPDSHLTEAQARSVLEYLRSVAK